MTTNTPTNENTEGPLIHFQFDGSDDPVLSISPKGFKYLGNLIEDAGEAHKVWMDVMNKVAYG